MFICPSNSAGYSQVNPLHNHFQHLKGGIHKYIEAYGAHGLWKGKNFVFDRRGAQSAALDGCVQRLRRA